MKLAHGSLTSFLLAATVGGAALVPATRAQGGGFTAYDLYVQHLPVGPAGGVITRLDPITGDSAVVASPAGTSKKYGTLAFDAYRQRVVFMGKVSGQSLFQLYSLKSSGETTPLGPVNVAWDGMSPTGDGRIYLHYAGSELTPIWWVDAANQFHVLYDTDGVTPYAFGGIGGYPEDMVYHPGENALFVVHSNSAAVCGGGNATSLYVRKLPLTADGTRLSGPTSCGAFDVYVGDFDVSAGLSLMPDGDILLGGHNGHYGAPLPRLIRVDPVTVAMTTFASFGDVSNGGSAWCSALGKAIAQTHFKNKLLVYSDGQVNGGVELPGGPLFTDTFADIIEIPALECDGGWIAYGAGLAGTGGIVPRLYGEGCPEPGAAITLHLDQAVGGSAGVLWAGFASAAAPFKGGTFHIGALLFSLPLAVGGTPGLAGAGSLSLPAALPPDPALTDLSVFLQAGFQDAAAVQGVSLTQGMEMAIG